MNRAKDFLICLLLGVILLLSLENHAVRKDQADMKAVYAEFLAKKVGNRTLEESIKPGSLAVFKSGGGIVGCAIFTGAGK